jgi:hypothetical protein
LVVSICEEIISILTDESGWQAKRAFRSGKPASGEAIRLAFVVLNLLFRTFKG